MIDGNVDDATYVVRVRAQVMARDDSSGGWVPMGGGGLSNVCVRRRNLPTDEASRKEYTIYGKRITDEMVVLCCTINRDFQYHKVMPTFHHWRTGDKRFGLTFQTAADARAFDKGVRSALDDVIDGSGNSPHNHSSDVGDDEIFMTLELPIDSRSSSGSSSGSGITGCLSSTTPSVVGDMISSTSSPCIHHLHRKHFIQQVPAGNGSGSSGIISGNNGSGNSCSGDVFSRSFHDGLQVSDNPGIKDATKEQRTLDNDKIEELSSKAYSYVQFSKDNLSQLEHEYSYPIMDSLKASRKDAFSSIGKHNIEVISSQPPLLPDKKKKGSKSDVNSPVTHVQCKHCLEMFNEEDNCRGSCEYAPDSVLACISMTSCISCAQCMLYHCLSDAEGDFNHHPCSCNTTDQHCHRHWVGLTILSVFVPCLWCYLPLRACHSCCSSFGLCGGRHEAI